MAIQGVNQAIEMFFLHGRHRLDLNIEQASSSRQFQNLMQCRNFFFRKTRTEPAAGAEVAQLFERSRAHVSAAVGCAVKFGVVQDDPVVGFAQANVELEPVGALMERAFKSRKSVLWRDIPRAAMSKIQWRGFLQ